MLALGRAGRRRAPGSGMYTTEANGQLMVAGWPKVVRRIAAACDR